RQSLKGMFGAVPRTSVRRNIQRMDLKAAFRATAAASVVIIVAACGGGTSDSSASSATASASPAVVLPVPSSSGSTSTSSRTPLCQPVDATTFIGGNLFVAEQGPIGVTLLSDGGMGPAIFDSVYQF